MEPVSAQSRHEAVKQEILDIALTAPHQEYHALINFLTTKYGMSPTSLQN